MITIDEFEKIEMRVGMVTEASEVEGSAKLIKLKVRVSVGGDEITVFTGVKRWYSAEFFTGKKFIFLVNLEYKKIMESESQGMILAAEHEDGKPIFLVPEGEIRVGARVR